jgi:HEAT repeat protein
VRTPVGDSQPHGAPAGGVSSGAAHGIGVFTTDTSLTVRTWDDWLARASGISADAARGRALTDLVPDLDARGLLSPFEQVLSAGIVEILAPAFHRYLIACPTIVRSRRFDRMQQRVTIGPLREDGRIIGTIVAIEDVTARVERERDLAAQLSSTDPDDRLRAVRLLADAEPLAGPDPLLSAIGDDNWRVRQAAVDGLQRRTTAGVVAAVLQALRDDHHNFSVLSSAIELLAATDADVVEPLLELLRYPDPDLRLQAALVLGERGDTRAVTALIDALSDPDENLRFHAIEALGKLKARAAVERLTAIAESGDFYLAFPALEALSHIGDPSVAPRLAPLLKDDLLRAPVAEVLGRIGDEDVVAPLTRLLNDATAPTEVVADALARVYLRFQGRYGEGEPIAQLVRQTITPTGTQNLLDAVHRAGTEPLRSVVKVLGWIEGPAVERALTLLLGQPSIRGKVVEYLVRQGHRVVELLIEQLDAEDLDTRHAAVVGLGRIGDRRATAPLVTVLLNEPGLRVATAGALARIGDGAAFAALLGLVGDPDPAVRQAVVAALNSIGHPEMAARVAPLLRDDDACVRESAVRIAGYFGYQPCAGDLLAACRDPEAAVRRAALEHLAFLDDPRAVETLLGALDDRDPVMRAAAVQSLGRVDDDRVGLPLLTALGDADPWVRYFAARALGDHRHAPAVDELTRAAMDDPAGHVRLAALDALGSIGDPAAIPAIAALSASEDSERAAAALRALGRIDHPDVWPPLKAALRVDEDARRASAAEAIAQAGGRDAIELLEWTAGADGSGTVVAAAIQGLAAVASAGSGDPAAVKALVGLSADGTRAAHVIAALAALPPSLTAEVAQGLTDPRSAVRVAVIQVLGRMRRAEASRSLQAGLNDEAPDVRLAALIELRHLGTRGIERQVVTLARTDPDSMVRRAALSALKRSSGRGEVSDTGNDPAPAAESGA